MTGRRMMRERGRGGCRRRVSARPRHGDGVRGDVLATRRRRASFGAVVEPSPRRPSSLRRARHRRGRRGRRREGRGSRRHPRASLMTRTTRARAWRRRPTAPPCPPVRSLTKIYIVDVSARTPSFARLAVAYSTRSCSNVSTLSSRAAILDQRGRVPPERLVVVVYPRRGWSTRAPSPRPPPREPSARASGARVYFRRAAAAPRRAPLVPLPSRQRRQRRASRANSYVRGRRHPRYARHSRVVTPLVVRDDVEMRSDEEHVVGLLCARSRGRKNGFRSREASPRVRRRIRRARRTNRRADAPGRWPPAAARHTNAAVSGQGRRRTRRRQRRRRPGELLPPWAKPETTRVVAEVPAVCKCPYEFCEWGPLLPKCKEKITASWDRLFPEWGGEEKRLEIMRAVGPRGQGRLEREEGAERQEAGRGRRRRRQAAARRQEEGEGEGAGRHRAQHAQQEEAHHRRPRAEHFGVDTSAAAKVFGKKERGSALQKGKNGIPDQIEIQGNCSRCSPSSSSRSSRT